MTGDRLKQDVLDWIQENRNLERHPLVWRLDVAKRLATTEDMRAAWDELAKEKYGVEDGRNIMSFAFSSAEAAHKECRRLPTTDEKERIAAVEVAIEKLRDAIAKAPSPLFDSAELGVVMNEKDIAFSWRASGDKLAQMHKAILLPVCLDELLEFAQNAIPVMTERQPTRTISRQRGDPELAAFVRHMAAWFQDRYGDKLMGTIARIATAVYDRLEPVTKEQVERILRTPSQ
jgi:hypothetical protein